MAKVSVCIPTYNTAQYLPEAIESVLAQEFTDFEIVICDNASTDQTPDICRGYSDPRLRYLRFEELTNQAGNFNRCLEAATGEFITLLHADDYFLPGFLSDRARRLTADAELGFVFGAVKVVDAASAIVSIKSAWTDERRFDRGELFKALLSGCLICPPSLMVRMSCAAKAGVFRSDLTWGHDWEWTLRLAENAAAEYVAIPFAAYRDHDANGTAEILSAATNGRQERLILKEALARVSARDDRRSTRRHSYRALSLRHMHFAEGALLKRKRRVAINNLWYAARADLRMLTRPTFWAMVTGAAGPVSLYERFRSVRGNLAVSGIAHE